VGEYTYCRRWLADWRSRVHAKPWMLFNLVLAEHAAGHFREAAEVARWGQRLLRTGHGGLPKDLAARYEVILAGEVALTAAPKGALARLDAIEASLLNEGDRCRLELARAVAVARRGGRDAFARAREHVAAAVRSAAPSQRALPLLHCHRRAVWDIGTRFGFGGWLWAAGEILRRLLA
jgi:hypothetical protein